jgi:hypothetical protein
MGIQEEINYYSNNMSLNFFIKNDIKILMLEDRIKRHYKRALKEEGDIYFTSQDLRSFVIALEKIHKYLNKKIGFRDFTTRLGNYKKVDGNIINEETKNLAKYIALALSCQRLLSLFNYHATLVYLIELKKEQEKEKSDEIFNHEILAGLLEIF